MYILERCKKKLSQVEYETFSESNDVVYIIDDSFRLCAYNDAWIQFANENGGKSVLEKFPLKSVITDAFSDEVKIFYCRAYIQVEREHVRFEHDYECSSADMYRLFHQTVYPIRDTDFMVISNHLVVASSDTPFAAGFDQRHINAHGSVIQCGHCRKIQDQSTPNKWDWVPELIRNPIPIISHTFCPLCLNYYYATFLK